MIFMLSDTNKKNLKLIQTYYFCMAYFGNSTAQAMAEK